MTMADQRAQGTKVVMFALMVLAAWQASPAVACSTSKENCNVTRCCIDKKLTCYEKNAEYAVCTDSCKKGVHDDDVGKWKTAWSCTPLNRDACSTTKGNCNVTKCCQDDTLTCHEKNAEFAKCDKACVKGKHADDEPPWNTPWSCNVLTPGAPATKAVAAVAKPVAKAGEKKVSEAKPKADAKGKKKSKCGGVFDKCGGKGYKGETCCLPGCKCQAFGKYHSSCQPKTGHGHKCIEDLVMVEVDDAAAEDNNLRGKSFGNAGLVTQLVGALAAVGTVTSFVVFIRRLRRQCNVDGHMLMQMEDPPAREVRIE